MISAAKKALVGAGLALLVSISLYTAYLRHEIAKRDATITRSIEDRAIALGAVKVDLVSERDLTKRLTKQNAELLDQLRKVDKRVSPRLVATAVATVSDTVPLQRPVAGGPIVDAYHRFTLAPDLLSLQRRQVFRLQIVVIRSLDVGKSHVAKVSIEELDPVTKETIPDTGEVSVETSVQMVEEGLGIASAVPVIHPRLVAGVQSSGYPLVGVEILNGERFGGIAAHLNLSLFGIYDTKDRAVLGGASVGWRLFNSNVSIGPAIFLGSKGATYGAAGVIQLTR